MDKTTIFSTKEKLLIDAVLYDVNNLVPAYLELRQSKSLREDMQRKMALRWWRSAPVKEYRATRTTGAAAEASKQTGQRSKADIIAELNRLISTETDNKRRGDLLMKLSDLLRENPADTAAEEQHIQYYLPLTCAKCELYAQWQQAEREKEVKAREKA